jgi:NADH-quinone oxidoreductase subunit N
MILAAADHFVSLFLGLEILTLALYVMIGFVRDRPMALEAGVKYLILAAAASAFLVLGMALLYAETGTMKISALLTGADGGAFGSLYALAGAALVVVGAGFKLGVVPFHMWAPDVYQGAPAPVTGFIASVSKSAMIAFLIRYLWYIDPTGKPELLFTIAAIAFLSMALGNILAIIQSNLKRLLAYSSIAHLGYVLVPLVVGGSLAREAVVFYMTVYGLSILGAFGLIAAISRAGGESDEIESWRGMFWRRPLAAAVMSVMMFSLAGIPLTAGFIGKYQIVLAGIEGSLWFLVMTLIVSSVIGLYYYLRVIAVMIDTAEPAAERLAGRGSSVGAVTVLTLVGVAVVYLGVYPGPLLELVRTVLIRSFL